MPAESDPNKPISLSPTSADQRLDRFLADALHLSRREVRQLLADGNVQLNSQSLCETDKGRLLSLDDYLLIRPFTRTEEQCPIPNPNLPVRELAHGPGWIILDKPAGMPVHPLNPSEDKTVLNAVIARHPAVFSVGEGGLRSGVVHRLDVGTSGALLMALDQPTWTRLRTAFQNHTIEKQYLAIVRGRLAGEGAERMNLSIAQHHPARVRVVPPIASGLPGGPGEAGGAAGARPIKSADSRPHRPPRSAIRQCTLHWRTEATSPRPPYATLLSITLETGFLHQIRVMLAHLGHPILGDDLYGGENAHLSHIDRPVLHAHRLILPDMEINITCPPPPDFQKIEYAIRNGMVMS